MKSKLKAAIKSGAIDLLLRDAACACVDDDHVMYEKNEVAGLLIEKAIDELELRLNSLGESDDPWLYCAQEGGVMWDHLPESKK